MKSKEIWLTVILASHLIRIFLISCYIFMSVIICEKRRNLILFASRDSKKRLVTCVVIKAGNLKTTLYVCIRWSCQFSCSHHRMTWETCEVYKKLFHWLTGTFWIISKLIICIYNRRKTKKFNSFCLSQLQKQDV